MLHYIPLGEDEEHEAHMFCDCSPVVDVDEDGNTICVHNKLDVYEYVVYDDEVDPSDVKVPIQITVCSN